MMNSMSFAGANINVQANNPDEFIDQLMEYADNTGSKMFGSV
jgi:hypothetical protein